MKDPFTDEAAEATEKLSKCQIQDSVPKAILLTETQQILHTGSSKKLAILIICLLLYIPKLIVEIFLDF